MELCQLVVLGLKESKPKEANRVYQEFKDQLGRNEAGWYETSLIWKADTSVLPNSKVRSMARLKTLLHKLRRNSELLEKYD